MRRECTTAGLLAMLALVMTTQAAGAAATQWYPQVGTTIEYQLSWNLSYKNGVRYTDTVFNVYNQTSENAIYIIPKASEDNIFAVNGLVNFNQLEAGVPVTLRHAYVETSVTTLGRHASIVAGSHMFNTGKIRVLVFKNNTWSVISTMNTTNDSLLKSSYFSEPNGFVDHVDCTKNPGDTFTDAFQASLNLYVTRLDATITGKSAGQITASSMINSSVCARGGYIAEASGQVLSYTYSVSGVTALTNIAGASCTYTRALPAGNYLPEWAYWIICGVLVVLAVGMAIIAAKRGRKK